MDWLTQLTDLVHQKPLIIFRFSRDEWVRLNSPLGLSSHFTIARSRTLFEDVRMPTAGLLIGSASNGETEIYFVYVKGRTRFSTLDICIRFVSARRIFPSAEQDLLHFVTKTIFESNLRIRLSSKDLVIPLSPKLSVDLVKQLASLEENRDAMRAVAEQLEAPKTYSGNIALQQDAVNLSLRTIRLSPTTPAVYAETVDGRETVLERVSIREDAAIALDATRVPGFALADIDLTGRAVFQNRREQLEIFTANRNDLELAFGVDLIYLNAVKGNIVMVQYKMLDPISEDQNTDWIYYPDSDQQFQKEIGRMRNFSQTHPPGRLEYRINPQVFYLRFVRRDRELGRSTQTMPIDHFELLREDPKCQGPKEGYRITYDTLEGRYLHQQAFVDLVRAGYIGAHATKTAELETLIGTILREGRAAVGALQTSLPLGRDAIQEEEPPSTRISLQGSLFDL